MMFSRTPDRRLSARPIAGLCELRHQPHAFGLGQRPDHGACEQRKRHGERDPRAERRSRRDHPDDHGGQELNAPGRVVDDPERRGANRRREHFVQQRPDASPVALAEPDEQHETECRDSVAARRVPAERDHRQPERLDDGKRGEAGTPAEPVAREPERDIAGDRSDLIHQQQPGDVAALQPARFEQVGRQPDRFEPVGRHVERRHREGERRGFSQRGPQHLAERRNVAEALVHTVLDAQQPHVGLWHFPADEHDEQRRQRGDHEREPPADIWRQDVAHHRREEAGERRPALQIGAVAAPHLRRHRLPDQRVRDGPLAADADAGDRARNQQRPEPDRHAGGERADAVDENGEHQQRLAAESIRRRASDDPSNRRERERRAQQDRHLVRREREVLHDRRNRRRHEKAEEEQIVEIEDPPDERERENLAVDREDRGAFAEQRHWTPMLR